MAKLQRFCAYQERCKSEVREKLVKLKVEEREQQDIYVNELEELGFLNEERFVNYFVGGRFRLKKWGKKKIRQHLLQKGIEAEQIEAALDNLDEEDYHRTLQALLEKKMQQSKIEDVYKKRDRVAYFAISKGYESSLVWELLKGMK